MNKLANGILNHRKTVLAVFIIAAIICALLSSLVKINYNLSDYLPDDAPSTSALHMMEKSFDEDIPNTSVYIPNVSIPQAMEYKEKMKAAPGVDNVLWLDDVTDVRKPLSLLDQDTVNAWYKDGGALFSVTVDNNNIVEAISSLKSIAGNDGSLAGDAVNRADAQTSVSKEIGGIMIMVIPLIFIILLISTSSWFEPVLFLAAIGIAIVINMGTDMLHGEISFVTQSTTSILQLAISMDYAIVLLHSFARFRQQGQSVQKAMSSAMTSSFTVIASSMATTVAGFSVLGLMRFKIGPDLGFSLAKGVIISFICVMVLLPVLAMTFSKLIERTHHRPLMPSFAKFGKLVVKICIPLAVVVLLILAPSYLAQENNQFVFGSSGMQSSGSKASLDANRINSLFGESQQMVLLVPDNNPAQESKLGAALKEIPDVTSVVSYDTAVGEQIPSQILSADVVSQFRSGGYSRLILSVSTPDEGDRAFAAVENVRAAAGQHYSEYYLVGQSVVNYDLKSVITADNTPVTIALVTAIGIILLIMFRSISLPVILLLAIESATWINLGIPYFTGDSLNYIGYQIISAVQLGATVDYGILFTHHYLTSRRLANKKESVVEAVTRSTPTVITPAGILILAAIMLGLFSSNGIISQLGSILGRGTAISTAMVLMVLPALLMLLDGLIQKTTLRASFKKGDLKK